jgi:hypothetical protein
VRVKVDPFDRRPREAEQRHVAVVQVDERAVEPVAQVGAAGAGAERVVEAEHELASTGWRTLRYYLGGEEYVRRGPPHVVLRMLVARVIVLSTVVLFATGVVLLAVGQTSGTIVGLHKASFIVCSAPPACTCWPTP